MKTSLVRLRDVCRKTGLSPSSVYAYVAAGRFPKPLKIGARASAWVENEIDEWIAAQIKRSRSNAI